MDNLEQANKQILSKKYGCEICNYYTERKNNLNNHFLTSKHFSNTNGQVIKQKLSKKYICEFCFQEYKYSSGLCKHRKKCLYIPKKEEKTVEEKTEPAEETTQTAEQPAEETNSA
jgi:hypothetical protein